MRNGVCDDDGLKVRVVDLADGIAAKDTVRADGVDLGGAGLLQLLRRQTKRPTRVGHVIDQDGYAVGDVADEHHGADFVGAHTLLVDQGKVNVQAIRYRGHTIVIFKRII